MMDAIFIGATLISFGICILYLLGCEKL